MPTEAEARELWCPMVRTTRTQSPNTATNRIFGDADSPRQSHCVASACMMWRTCGDIGFCGLAGRPINITNGN